MQRLQLYSKLDRVKDPAELRKLVQGIMDRFGPLPYEVEQLVDIVKLRWQGCQAGFEKLTLKKSLLKATSRPKTTKPTSKVTPSATSSTTCRPTPAKPA